MRRVSVVLATTFSFILILTIASAIETAAQSGGLVTTVNSAVWLRAGPGVEWRKLQTLNPGTTMALDGYAFEGMWVRGITSDGAIGWVAASYLDAPQDQILALPAIWVDEPFTLSAPAPGSTPATTASELPTPTAAPAASVTGGREVTTTTQVRLRSGPGTRYRIVATLSSGTTLRLDGRDASGGWVRGINTAGDVGWVSSRYVSGVVSDLPVVDVDTPFGLSAPSAPEGETSTAPATSALPAPVVNAAPPVSGFNLGGHVEGFSETAANWMRTARMTWVKRQWRYYQGQDGSAAAGLIAEAHARGFRILVAVVGVASEVNNPGYFEQYAGFVAGVARSGADAIEVWNEQNIDREWPAGSIDPGRYTQLLAKAYNAIKAANAGTMVISGAPAPTGFFGGCSPNGCDDAPYVAGMAAAGAANYMDCLGIHYNEGIIPPTQTSGDPRSEHYTRYFWGMINTYKRAFGGARPLCFTELGYLSPEGYGTLPGSFGWAQNVTVAQQAAWLDQAVSLAAGSGVRLLIVWNIDYRNFGADPQGGYAVIRPDGSCPACVALGS